MVLPHMPLLKSDRTMMMAHFETLDIAQSVSRRGNLAHGSAWLVMVDLSAGQAEDASKMSLQTR